MSTIIGLVSTFRLPLQYLNITVNNCNLLFLFKKTTIIGSSENPQFIPMSSITIVIRMIIFFYDFSVNLSFIINQIAEIYAEI